MILFVGGIVYIEQDINMQTFVPYTTFTESAAALDSKRLNKQLLEGRQIYNILRLKLTTGAWVNHPAVKMWRNYNTALFHYLTAIKNECDFRGIKTDTNWQAILRMRDSDYGTGVNLVMPPWWGDERVHLSHRQNLYNKNPEYYDFFINDSRLPKSSCCDKCNYFWPTHILMYNGELLEPFQYIK